MTKTEIRNYFIEELSACVGFLSRLPVRMRSLTLGDVLETMGGLNDQMEPAEAKAFRLPCPSFAHYPSFGDAASSSVDAASTI